MTPNIGRNWAGTYEFRAQALATPATVDEVQSLVADTPRIRSLGTRHSFSDIADTTGVLVSLAALPPEISIDSDARTVTVSSATPYGTLAGVLERSGWALHNLGSLPHISVGGAISTGTHGSGDLNGTLSTAVSALEFVSGRGELVRVDRSQPTFDGWVVSLGALGVITRVTLDIRPSYQVRQDIYVDLPWQSVLDSFDAITSSAYSVSMFTKWQGDSFHQLWLKSVVDDGSPVELPAELFGARAAAGKVYSPADDARDNTTVQGGVPGPWSERLPHFRFDATPSNGDEIQSEFFIDRRHAPAALSALRELAPAIAPHVLVTELRTMAADTLWLSQASGRASVAIHFTWKNDPAGVLGVLPDIEAVLAPFGARPHWGKVFTAEAAEIAPLYPRLREFTTLAETYDPDRQFRNAYLERTLALPL